MQLYRIWGGWSKSVLDIIGQTLETLEERLGCRMWYSSCSALWDRCSETPLSDRWV